MRFLRLLFHKDSVHDQLRELYRSSESGGDVPDVDPAARETFEADQELTSQLSQLAASVQPIDASLKREALLARVRERKSLQVEERLPAFRQLFQKRTLVAGGAAVLLLGAAATVGASGGVSDVAGNVEDVLEALQIMDKGPDAEHPDVSGGQEEGLEHAGEHANENAEHGLDNAAEGSDNAGDGIGNASDQGQEQASETALDGPSGPNSEGPTLPTQANQHASDGPDNGEGARPESPGQSTEDHGSPDGTPEATEVPEATETPEPTEAPE